MSGSNKLHTQHVGVASGSAPRHESAKQCPLVTARQERQSPPSVNKATSKHHADLCVSERHCVVSHQTPHCEDIPHGENHHPCEEAIKLMDCTQTQNCSRCIAASSEGEEGGGTDLDDRHPHEAHSVVGQQLHFDGRRPHKRQGDGPKIGGHRSQPDLQPQLALQIQIRHQHWYLHFHRYLNIILVLLHYYFIVASCVLKTPAQDLRQKLESRQLLFIGKRLTVQCAYCTLVDAIEHWWRLSWLSQQKCSAVRGVWHGWGWGGSS